ncbi:MAG: TadE/TadG family type IV pilus assembly protein [Pirellulaceae bacterium]
MKSRQRKSADRSGATVVEMAMCLPVLFLLLFGCYEFARANMMRHATEAAAYEGARVGIVPGAKVSDVEDACRFVLSTVGIREFDVEVNPSPITRRDRKVRVTVTLKMRDNTSIGLLFNEESEFRGECELTREGF